MYYNCNIINSNGNANKLKAFDVKWNFLIDFLQGLRAGAYNTSQNWVC
ncbi:hypothetical protein CAEBREN_25586 [Caenorhabditis brenneri]|uniref:Uncharacterized protein n=1 Tax=Caenorhabditis brenneri TaxID=135651 RepID=G0MDN7_CAEBE|nr:hypothetical protein CAEBREN_25586 [Caenorhabditis brenneri]